ncbi:hypothetical protein [Persicitalea sp.]|uniref:hypothetical protein n=1 Tax=Persicitalea sp. TaxID=3100273 RepID=UPI003594701B
MKKTDYEYWLDESIIAIQDLHGEESVTANAAEVLLEIQQEMGSLKGYLVVWKSRDGIWDGLFYRNKLVGTYNLGYMTFEAAKEMLQRLSPYFSQEYVFNSDRLEDCRNVKGLGKIMTY